MRDKVRKRPVFNDRHHINSDGVKCRNTHCEDQAKYQLIYFKNGFSYTIMHCKDHKEWAEGLAHSFEDIIDD
jgi:hypothetical protein